MQPVAHSASRHAAVQMGVVCTPLSVVLATAAPPPAPAAHAASSTPGAASGRAAPQGYVPAAGRGGGRAELGHVRGLAGGAARRRRGPGARPPARRAPARRVGLGQAGRAPARRAAVRVPAPLGRAGMRRAMPRCWAAMGSLGLCISGAEPSEPCYHFPRSGQSCSDGRSCAACIPALPERGWCARMAEPRPRPCATPARAQDSGALRFFDLLAQPDSRKSTAAVTMQCAPAPVPGAARACQQPIGRCHGLGGQWTSRLR